MCNIWDDENDINVHFIGWWEWDKCSSYRMMRMISM